MEYIKGVGFGSATEVACVFIATYMRSAAWLELSKVCSRVCVQKVAAKWE